MIMKKRTYINNSVSFIVSAGSREIVRLKLKSYIISLGKVLTLLTFIVLLLLAGYSQYSIHKEKKELTFKIKKIESEIDFLKNKQSTFKTSKTKINEMLGYK